MDEACRRRCDRPRVGPSACRTAAQGKDRLGSNPAARAERSDYESFGCEADRHRGGFGDRLLPEDGRDPRFADYPLHQGARKPPTTIWYLFRGKEQAPCGR